MHRLKDKSTFGSALSRRQAVGAVCACAGAMARVLASPADAAPIRVSISETLIGDVNMNDARAAMLIWLKKIQADLNVALEFSSKVFDTTAEIVQKARTGQLDAAALNILEYRQIADLLDSSQVVASNGASGADHYILLTKRSNGIAQVSGLKGRSLRVLKAPTLCLASAWITVLLAENGLPSAEEFFGSITTDTKVSRVVLPVFFNQADACIVSDRGYAGICELNPQVGRDLIPVATSDRLLATFYVFHRNYRSGNRQKFINVLSDVLKNAAGRQMATLFQFDSLALRDGSCLSSALALLERADRIREHRAAGERK